jgi:RNA polymerase sigma-70 factor, ECF subfamily
MAKVHPRRGAREDDFRLTMAGNRVDDPGQSQLSHELLRRAQAGDSHAMSRLFSRYLPPLRKLAHRRVPVWARNAVDTGDLVQETILQAFKRLPFFEDRQKGVFIGYLRRSLVNRIRDQFRNASRRPVATDLDESTVDPGQSPLERAITKQDRARYLAGLGKLQAADRAAIVGRMELGYSYEQLALVLKKPTAESARIAVRRALGRLAERMQQEPA